MQFDSTEQQPISDTLLKEQTIVQEEKFNKRLLDQYNCYIFLGALFKDNRTSEVEEFLENNVDKGIHDFEGLLSALGTNIKRPVHWTDMGGGYGLAQRQAFTYKQVGQKIETTNVDIFERKIADLSEKETEYLKNKFPGVLDPDNSPNFIQANVENVKLPIPADLLTSVEVVQYLDNPLKTISNWYNQLSPEGLMIVSAEHSWSDWILYEGAIFSGENSPLVPFFNQLEVNKIPFSFSQDCYLRNNPRQTSVERGFCNLVIKKVPETKIELLAKVKKVQTNFNKYKAVYYENISEVIEVTGAD